MSALIAQSNGVGFVEISVPKGGRKSPGSESLSRPMQPSRLALPKQPDRPLLGKRVVSGPSFRSAERNEPEFSNIALVVIMGSLVLLVITAALFLGFQVVSSFLIPDLSATVQGVFPNFSVPVG